MEIILLILPLRLRDEAEKNLSIEKASVDSPVEMALTGKPAPLSPVTSTWHPSLPDLLSFRMVGTIWVFSNGLVLGRLWSRTQVPGEYNGNIDSHEKWVPEGNREHSEWQKCRFVRVERERRHSTNKYLLSAYCVPGTVHIPPAPVKKNKNKTGQRQQKENSEGEKMGS